MTKSVIAIAFSLVASTATALDQIAPDDPAKLLGWTIEEMTCRQYLGLGNTREADDPRKELVDLFAMAYVIGIQHGLRQTDNTIMVSTMLNCARDPEMLFADAPFAAD